MKIWQKVGGAAIYNNRETRLTRVQIQRENTFRQYII